MKRKVEAQNVNLLKIKKKKTSATKVLSAEERLRKKTSLYSAPTSEELNQLRENENLYKSNLFRMQIQYLLEEVCLKDKKVKKINDALHSLNTFIKSTCSQSDEHQMSGDCLPRGVEFPLPCYISREKIKGKFRYIAPKEVTVIGSYLLKTMTKPRTSIDIAVEMPLDCLQPRDTLNYRYYFKRAAYLSWLAFYLKDWELTDTLHFSSTYNQYKPTLCLTLKGKNLKSYFINIHLAIPNGIFKLSRFSPLTSNIRTDWFNRSDSSKTAIPTPHYNSGILSDMLFEDHLKVLYAAIKECPAIREAVCLFKVWLKQRTFKGACTFNGFVGSMFMVYLLKKKQISFNLSSYQIFKIAMHSLATTDWSKHGITLREDKSLVPFHEKFDVVFVDSTGELNLCADITKLTYNMIRYQATLSLSILDNSMEGGFDPLFIKQQHFLQVADHSFRLDNLVDFHKQLIQNHVHKASIMDFGGDWLKLVPNIISEILLSGLDKRLRLLFEKPGEEKQWAVTSCVEVNKLVGNVWFGLLLDSEYSENVLSMGPSADQPEAKKFRKIWGTKSELRRFPDGSINEAVLWPCTNKEETKFVCKQIVQHLLYLHCNIPLTSISYHGGEFNVCLKRKYIEADELAKNKPGSGEEEGICFIKTFEKLCKEINAIENLPLKIHSIDGIDPAFRMTEVNTPLQHNLKPGFGIRNSITVPKFEKKLPRFCPVYNVVLQFETSGKWPDDILAIQHIKAAFHLKLADSIRSSLNIPAVASPGFVDVCKNGYVFRISVVNYREMILYRENLNVGSLLKKECEVAAHQLDIIIVKKPLHNSLIKSLYSQYHEYPLTVRLAKRWIAAQMFSEFLSEEAVELVVAFLFLCPQPSEAPRSHMSGFIRFLEFMNNHDWNNEPIIVNLNNQITNEEYHKIKENFELNRDQLPPMCVVCSYDHQGGLWTKNINKQILRRLALLADSALKYIDTNIWSNVFIAVEPIFRPPMSDYHVVIELKKEMVPLYYLNIDSTVRSKPIAIKDSIESTYMPVVGFNPPKLYLEELRSAFSEIALFFYDAYGGTNIGVIWKLSALSPQPFKILHARYQTLVKADIKKTKKKIVPCSTPMAVPNISAIIDDFKIIGRDLVSDIIVLQKN